MGQENVPSFQEVFSLYGKVIINSFSITHVGMCDLCRTGTGLYLGFSVHDHSCRPAAEFHFNGSKIVLQAHDPNAVYSKDLTISYVPTASTRQIRQKNLRSQYFFDCECERCMDEKLELLERSGKSDCCPENGAVLPVDRKFLWYFQCPLVCINCGEKADITLDEIKEANDLAARMVSMEDEILATEHSKSDANTLMELLDDLKTCLSPYNLNLLKYASIVASVYTDVYKIPTFNIKYDSAEKKALEIYSCYTILDNISCVITQFKAAIFEAKNNPSTEAFSKVHAYFQETLNVANENYGSEHPLYKEIILTSKIIKGEFGQMKDDEDKRMATGEKGDY